MPRRTGYPACQLRLLNVQQNNSNIPLLVRTIPNYLKMLVCNMTTAIDLALLPTSDQGGNVMSICSKTSFTDVATLGISKGACVTAALAFYGAVKGIGGGSYKDASDGKFCEFDGPANVCDSNSLPSESCWTARFSEELNGSQFCPDGKAMTGAWCLGSYCDNKHLKCSPMEGVIRRYYSDWISEESPNSAINLNPNKYEGVILGMRCKGDFCDDISVDIGNSFTARVTSSSAWLPWFSEEQYYQVCDEGQFVTGIQCRGSYCDDLKLRCTPMYQESTKLNQENPVVVRRDHRSR